MNYTFTVHITLITVVAILDALAAIFLSAMIIHESSKWGWDWAPTLVYGFLVTLFVVSSVLIFLR